jgi:hypothetical protein
LEKISDNLYIQSISGSDSKKKRDNIIKSFQDSNKTTILCSAKVLQEGVDIPKCDGVMFVDIKKSTIDTIQSLSRCLTFLPNKQSYIMIPYDDINDIKNDEYTSDLRIILRNIVEIDENLKEYFKSSFKSSSKSKSSDHPKSSINSIDLEIYNKYLIDSNFIINFVEICYDTYSIAKEKVFNKYSNYSEYLYSVKNDFNDNIPSNPDIVYKNFGWKSWNDFLGLEDSKINFELLKKQISNLMFSSNFEYIDYAKSINIIINPEIIYRKYWISWYNFLSFNIDIFPSNKNEWKNICVKYKLNSENYFENAKKYNLPLMPCELYKDFTNISNELNENYYDFF